MKGTFFGGKRLGPVSWRTVSLFLLIVLLLSSFSIRDFITGSIVTSEPLRETRHLVIESWSGEREILEEGKKLADRLRQADVSVILFEEYCRNQEERERILLRASDAGLDTHSLRLIEVPRKDPKTLNISVAVIDTVHKLGWNEMTLATIELHTARSRKSYLRAAEPYGIAVTVVGLPYKNINADNWYTKPGGLWMAFTEFLKVVYYELFIF